MWEKLGPTSDHSNLVVPSFNRLTGEEKNDAITLHVCGRMIEVQFYGPCRSFILMLLPEFFLASATAVENE